MLPNSPRFDIDGLRADQAAARPWNDTGWLAESWRDADAFATALISYSSGLLSPPAKSSLQSGCDLYHDAVLRFVAQDRAALRTIGEGPDGRVTSRSLSYGELHTRVTNLAATLRARGLKAGDPLCILLPMGESFVVTLCAGLRLGLLVGIVQPRGERLVARRIAALKPACVVTERLYSRLHPASRATHVILDERESDLQIPPPLDDRSHTYAPAAPALALFSPLHSPITVPGMVPSTLLYARALRDGLCIFGLRAGDGLCAPSPDFDLMQYQPALLLSTLLCGATYVHCDAAVIGRDPSLLTRAGVTCLGIGRTLRDALRKLPSPQPLVTTPALAALGRLHCWFRPALDPLDVVTYRELDARAGLSQVPRMQLVYDAAQGGVVLTSARYRGDASLLVWPAPGCAWKLSPVDALGSTAAAPGQHGLYLPAGSKKEAAALLLAKAPRSVGDGYLLAGTLGTRRAGHVYPEAEVEAALAELPGVAGCCVMGVPDASEAGRTTLVLLLFTGGAATDAGLRSQIERQIEFALGAEHAPDHLEIYPLYPRRDRKTGALDRAWCRTQYVIGALQQKTTRRSSQLLTALRAACAQLPGAAKSA